MFNYTILMNHIYSLFYYTDSKTDNNTGYNTGYNTEDDVSGKRFSKPRGYKNTYTSAINKSNIII